MRRLSFLACLLATLSTEPIHAQDGASYTPAAKAYRAAQPSLAGSPDTPERSAALAPLWQGHAEEALPKLKALADAGDVPSALLLANFYRRQSRLPVKADPALAVHYLSLASAAHCGEASELMAEMIEKHEVEASAAGGDASFWRDKAREQGWKQQQLKVAAYDWIHGPEVLHCQVFVPSEGCPTDAQLENLQAQGITGLLRFHASWTSSQSGPEAGAMLILDHNAPTEQDLLEPDSASVIYLQTPANTWRMFPADAPLLDRYLVLKPNEGGRGTMLLEVQNVDGSGGGGSVGRDSPK